MPLLALNVAALAVFFRQACMQMLYLRQYEPAFRTADGRLMPLVFATFAV
jgi:hypothetical protein